MEPPLTDNELEQHEVAPLLHHFHLGRRDFFTLLGCGLLVSLAARRAMPQESGLTRGGHEVPQDLDAWLHIGETGEVTAFTGKVEVGQNARTSLTQQIAEELRVPLSSIRLVMGDTELTPYDMGTFGSRTTPQMGPQVRKVAATARTVLLEKAAENWHVPPADLSIENGQILDPKRGRRISYSELTRGQKLAKLIPDDPELRPPQDWTIAGAAAAKIRGRDFVTGAHKYSSDISFPGIVEGKIVRPPAFHARLLTSDAAEAEKIANVVVVRDGDFIGVVGPDKATAERAASAVKLVWDAPRQSSEADLFSYLRKPNGEKPGEEYVVGSVDQVRRQAPRTLERSYTVAYIAHVPLEPRAAVAAWKGDQLTVWTGTQRPFAVRDELASAFHIPEAKVRVIVPDTGSAYGGKHSGEAAVEAARLAKNAGRPVKLVWTREEEFTWAYFRPAGVIDVKSGAQADGTLVFWEFDNYNSGPAAMRTPYEVPHQRIRFHPTDAPLRQGSYRSLAAAANHFARESHMDELAHELKMDPLEFRLKNLSNQRLRAAFETVAERFGWAKQKHSRGRGSGIAGGIEKGGHVAACAEVESNGDEIKVIRVVETFDCGAVVNPQGLRNQVSGAIVQGLGGALFEAIHFENGRILNPRLSQYRVPRFSDLPEIEVLEPDHKDQPPVGAGETPLTGIAPAIANAIFDATGVRLRSMPLVPKGLPKSAST